MSDLPSTMQALTVKRVENVGYRERTRDGMRGEERKVGCSSRGQSSALRKWPCACGQWRLSEGFVVVGQLHMSGFNLIAKSTP